MRGIFIEQPWQLTLEVDGESFTQGQSVSGRVSVQNLSNEPQKLENLKTILVVGNKKKIKERDPEAFSALNEQLLIEEANVATGESRAFDFKFDLDVNCPNTEKASGVYVQCSLNDDLAQKCFLELNVTPHEIITQFLVVFENLFRFKVKSFKNKKDGLEATVIVPGGKELSSVQQLKMLFNVSGKDLVINYQTKVTKMDFSDGQMQSKSSVQKFEQTLTEKDYSVFGSVNQEGISKAVESYLDTVKLKPIL
jgi:hypothetical protein